MAHAMDRRMMNSSYMQSRIKDLHMLHKATVEDYGALVESLNAECDILIELIPSYKISTTVDESVQKKKEVHTIEKLEHELLTQYQHFLQLLKRMLRKTHPEQQALGSRLCAKLIPAAHEFNNNENLLRLAVDFANAKATRVAQPCQKALQELLDGELVSEAAHFIVSAILDIVRREEHALNPKLLQTLLAVRVAMIDMHRPDVAEAKAKNKRMKKQDKELARQMMKGQARRDRAELAAKQTKMVHLIFVVYLRVLQAAQSCNRVHQTKILAPCLEGLAKFAPLVNQEHYHLLMKALRELVDSEESSVTTKMHALVAVSCLAQKDANLDASEWKTDLTHFHNVLFNCIPEALTPPEPEKVGEKEQREKEAEEAEREGDGEKAETSSVASTATVGSLGSVAFSIAASMAHHKFVKEYAAREWSYRASVLLRALDLLVLVPKHLPVTRVLCFLRRLLQYASQCPPHIALAIMAVSHRLVLRYPSAASVFVGGADYALVGRGVYNPDAQDLESSFPDASFCWELSVLRNSYHPSVRQVATMLTTHYHKLSKHKPGAPPVVSPQLARLGPYEILQKFDACLGDVQPPPRKPKNFAANSGNRAVAVDAEAASTMVAAEAAGAPQEAADGAAAPEALDSAMRSAFQPNRKVHRTEGGDVSDDDDASSVDSADIDADASLEKAKRSAMQAGSRGRGGRGGSDSRGGRGGRGGSDSRGGRGGRGGDSRGGRGGSDSRGGRGGGGFVDRGGTFGGRGGGESRSFGDRGGRGGGFGDRGGRGGSFGSRGGGDRGGRGGRGGSFGSRGGGRGGSRGGGRGGSRGGLGGRRY